MEYNNKKPLQKTGYQGKRFRIYGKNQPGKKFLYCGI